MKRRRNYRPRETQADRYKSSFLAGKPSPANWDTMSETEREAWREEQREAENAEPPNFLIAG